LPADWSAAGTLSLRTNYRGPAADDMRWTFEAFDVQAGAWETIADNGFASDWVWTTAVFPVGARFVSSTGEVLIRYGTDSPADASDLDELVLLAGGAPSATPPSAPSPA